MDISQRAGETKFSLYDREDYPLISGVTQFKYLCRMTDKTDSDWLTVKRNINKSRAVWRRLGKPLRREGAESWVSALFYRAVIQELLVFGLEFWALSDAMIGLIEASHVSFKSQITEKQERCQADGTWETPVV